MYLRIIIKKNIISFVIGTLLEGSFVSTSKNMQTLPYLKMISIILKKTVYTYIYKADNCAKSDLGMRQWKSHLNIQRPLQDNFFLCVKISRNHKYIVLEKVILFPFYYVHIHVLFFLRHSNSSFFFNYYYWG